MTRLLAILFLFVSVPVFAQTPKEVEVPNATVTKRWVITGYEVLIPDAANPQNGSIGIQFQFQTIVDGATVATETKRATVSGPVPMLAIMADVDTRVRAAITANDANAYYTGTRAALYAWLQANGHIDKAAQ